MDTLELKAEVRQTGKGHAKNLRKQGLVPVVMYGQGTDADLLQIDARSLTRVMDEAGTHQLVALKVGRKRPVMALAREIQRDSITRQYLHVDFFKVKMDEKVTASVPLEMVGEAPAVADLGGVLTQGLDQLEIECLPNDLVSSIEVNIENLKEFNDSITVADLAVPEAITILSDPSSMVVKIEAPRKEEELEAAEGEIEAGAEPEVITEARDEEE
ncbi:MAG: 50S ribosomal protein L25 [Chloroflexi bacterium]|nr:MAG: 50S ribosomal protein L25 [Chloroflexota bacterium]